MIEAAREHATQYGFEVRFDSTIPSGAKTCHFTLWRPSAEEKATWDGYTELLEQKALVRSRREKKPAP